MKLWSLHARSKDQSPYLRLTYPSFTKGGVRAEGKEDQ